MLRTLWPDTDIFDLKVTPRDNEAGIHVIRLMLSGTFDRHRYMQVISGHWGEMVPFYLQRMDECYVTRGDGLVTEGH